MLLLEINEFNPELMAKAAKELNADNLRWLLALQRSETTTDDKAERFGLDPWVQWVSIHTGKTSDQHGVKHLGDVPQLQHEQIWETLSKKGLRCGVWGAMNASRGSAKNCEFFFPDPWTFSEMAYPAELNNLLMFPRYFSKNYGDLDKVVCARELAKLLWFCLNPRIALQLLPLAPRLISSVIKNGLHEYLLFVLFDLVNAKLFVHYYKRTRPDFAILFMNSLAHLQHHKWTSQDYLSEEMRVAFAVFDEVLGTIRNGLAEEESLVVANAFTQFCSYDQNEFLYRQINPHDFLVVAGITFVRVEQAMTNDGHVFFESAESANQAAKTLEAATVNGKPAFHVELDHRTPTKIFFQVIVWEPLPSDAILEINNKTIKFFEQFEVITQRSGSHLQEGHAFSKNINLPKKLYNHEIHDKIIEYFHAA
jgi:hypothetical protein